MRIITQTFLRNHIVYYVKTMSAVGKVVTAADMFECRVEIRKDGDERGIYVLDRFGRVRQDPARYINKLRVNLPFGSRRQIAGALMLFYVYAEIHDYDVQNLTPDKVAEFVQFLYGSTVQDEPGKPQHVIRSAKTVNGYFGMIRRFVETMGWSDAAYSKYKTVVLDTPIGGELFISRNVKKSIYTLRTGSVTERQVPKHVTPPQMKEIAGMMCELGDRTSQLLSHLQYCYGLRCGEALGLTEEDVVMDMGDEPSYMLILRNRLTDRGDQSCKGLMHPASRQQYLRSQFKQSRWDIPITKATYDRIISYIGYTHNQWLNNATVKQRQNYMEDTVADSVTEPRHDGNRYIFIGNNGRRLSGQTWNTHLASYFQRVGIELDYGVKSANCSHRLRHGFAMFHAQYSEQPMNIMELKKALRHASISTCAIYYDMLPEDELRLKERFQTELSELIPEFAIDL